MTELARRTTSTPDGRPIVSRLLLDQQDHYHIDVDAPGFRMTVALVDESSLRWWLEKVFKEDE